MERILIETNINVVVKKNESEMKVMFVYFIQQLNPA